MTALMNLLVVEDNDIDIERIERFMASSQLPNPLHHAFDGEEALDQLRGMGGGQPIDRPCLVLLDLNMPRMNGLEFLEELRNEPELADTPVLVLTTSDRQEDIDASLRLGAVDCLTKPITREQLAKIIVSFDAQQHARLDDERTYTMALIDDDPVFRELVGRSARGTGWSVRLLASQRDALELLPGRMPDVVVVDQRLGATTGVELLEELVTVHDFGQTRLYLASEAAISVSAAQRANALGASIIEKDTLSTTDDLVSFLEHTR